MARQPRVLSVVTCYLVIAFAHLCSCIHYANYNEYILENEKICHIMDKHYTHYLRNSTAAIVTTHHMFDRWSNINFDRKCHYTFKSKSEGLFAVIHKMFFRQKNGECLDYVRFQRNDGHHTQKICGEIDRNKAMYIPVSKAKDSQIIPLNKIPLLPDLDIKTDNENMYDMFAEFDVSKSKEAQIRTEIFISKEKVPDGQYLDLSIIYTPYTNCNKVNITEFTSVGHNTCIRTDYFCDKIHNCPYRVCSDEVNCMYMITDRFPKNDTATKVTVGAVTTIILCLIIFVMCLWICKKSRKLCWSSDCAGPNVCSRPGSLPQDADSAGSNRAVPTAPMLEVAMSSPVADKDLPPSYDSLFPEQSNPARP